jgi:hypothetical protein
MVCLENPNKWINRNSSGTNKQLLQSCGIQGEYTKVLCCVDNGSEQLGHEKHSTIYIITKNWDPQV